MSLRLRPGYTVVAQKPSKTSPSAAVLNASAASMKVRGCNKSEKVAISSSCLGFAAFKKEQLIEKLVCSTKECENLQVERDALRAERDDLRAQLNDLRREQESLRQALENVENRMQEMANKLPPQHDAETSARNSDIVLPEFRQQTKKGRQPKQTSTVAAVTMNNDDSANDGEKTKKRQRKRCQAMVVEANKEVSYADILRVLRTDESLTTVGQQMSKVRRTKNGSLLFELKHGREANPLTSALEKALEGKAKVSARAPITTVECRNLDEIATPEEVSVAIREMHGVVISPEAIRVRPAFPKGTQRAFFALYKADAEKLLSKPRLQVGWTVCSLREVIRETKCYHCWRLGHNASQCTGPDHTALCMKCGDKGHKRVECVSQQKCLDCSGESAYGHATGSYHCPNKRAAWRTASK
uniref:CCHC-type domain-containing protein n=1 Tax=Anopheles maculatus TaxID=74869 RepID=A0A182SSQ4_9DIPT